ncbi:MAG: box helicase, partial [Flavipsychrobacter sp.]|nr:box helicase [Flavipsychrobacter sp.]
MQQKKFSFDTILASLKIDALNEMQEASLVAHDKHNDIVLLSATGSGKTLAFLLPLLQQLDPATRKTQALIVVPSRELAQQIEQVFRSMGTGLKITSCYGGHKREIEENNLIEAPSVIVGTPGRLGDHMRRNNITVDAIETLILDEFDKSLDMGFTEEMEFIISSLPNVKRRVLTSATEAVEIPEFVGLEEPVTLNFLHLKNEESAGLDYRIVESPDADKLDTLFQLLCSIGNRSSIIFCNHRESV